VIRVPGKQAEEIPLDTQQAEAIGAIKAGEERKKQTLIDLLSPDIREKLSHKGSKIHYVNDKGE